MYRPLITLLLTAMMLLAAPAARAEESPAEHLPVSAFFGTYEGRTLFPMGEQGNRDLNVEISDHEPDGFVVRWETTIPKGENDEAVKGTALTFRPTRRPRIFAAVYPPDGQPDLIAGDSFAWARIEELTMTVHVMTILDDGDYVMQSYHRTLTDAGLRLEFLRLREGKVERHLKGNLTRVNPEAGAAATD